MKRKLAVKLSVLQSKTYKIQCVPNLLFPVQKQIEAWSLKMKWCSLLPFVPSNIKFFSSPHWCVPVQYPAAHKVNMYMPMSLVLHFWMYESRRHGVWLSGTGVWCTCFSHSPNVRLKRLTQCYCYYLRVPSSWASWKGDI